MFSIRVILFFLLACIFSVKANADEYGFIFFQDGYPTAAGFESKSEACEYWRSYIEEDHAAAGTAGSATIISGPAGSCRVQFIPVVNPNHVLRYGRTLVWMQVAYASGIPDQSQPQQCTVGNPVDTSTGAKIQKETDISPRARGGVSFERTYNNNNQNSLLYWFNSYQKYLRVVDPQQSNMVQDKSSVYIYKSQACTRGWSELQQRITASWAQGATAQYSNEKCQVVNNNVVVRNLPILPRTQGTAASVPAGAIQLVRGDGSIFSFELFNTNQYRSLNGERGQLNAVNATPIAWRFKSNTGDIEDYDANGKLRSITAASGVKQELHYAETTGLLSYVQDSTGRRLDFSYTNGQLSSITYDTNKTIQYTYNSIGLLAQVTYSNNTSRIYHYENLSLPKALTGITDERGVRYATWTYDAQGRAISSEHAGGADKTLLAFNADGSTTVTNPLGKKTIYRFDDIVGARRVVSVEGQPTASCAGANQNYTYTSEGWLASKTDWNGVQTIYAYNSLGQETSRTEAFGTPEAKTITSEWHPTLYLKTKETEPGREILYSYDANGNLLSQTVNSTNP